MQAVVKDAIRDAVSEINQQKWEWPYHAYQNSQFLQKGETEYAWPLDFKSVDWNTFQIRKNDALGIKNTHLKAIDRNRWYEYLRDRDDDNSVDGLSIPTYVFKAHGNGFGVSPSPDQDYELEFRYFINEPVLQVFSDTTFIPSQFDNVITSGALYHMNLFRENKEGVAIAQDMFKVGIKNMYTILVGQVSPDATSTVVNFGVDFMDNSGNYKV
jgi:hypothetical protein